jgi:PKHD-type hydroxylase
MVEYFTVKNFFTEQECDEIANHSIENLKLERGLIGLEARYDEKMRKSSVSMTSYDSTFPYIKNKLFNTISNNIKIKGYEISFENQPYQFTKYETGEYYNWHIDSFETGYMASRYCSIVVQLNDSYTGGDLQMQKDEDIITFERGKGNLFVFLSSILHRVTTVTDGTRYSLVNWFTLKPVKDFKKTLI